MAATRLIAMHIQQNRSIQQCIKDRTDYAKNGEKTEMGQYISSYECNPDTVDKEFEFSKSQYGILTGRTWKNDVIAYQIRQSFLPGEITPEEANRIGFETAMRWTKGKHAFIVATHVDKAHIHSHIIYNSTTLDNKSKFKNFFYSAIALQKVSDLVCLENGYSVIDKKKPSEREKRTIYQKKKSSRDLIREDIQRLILDKKPRDLEELLRLLEEENYQIKRGKHIALLAHNQKKYIRLSSLGDGYEEGDFDRILGIDLEKDVIRKSNTEEIVKEPGYRKKRIESIIDIQDVISAGKGAGYERWAKVHNVKQIAESLVLMKELGVDTISELSEKADKISIKSNELLDIIKTSEIRLKEITELKMNIINYSKTRDVYVSYRKGGYKKEFFEAHREALTIHKAAKDAFGKLEGKIPTLKELNAEYRDVLKKKRVAEVQYYPMKKQNRDLQMAKYNLERLRNQIENEEKIKDRNKKRDENCL